MQWTGLTYKEETPYETDILAASGFLAHRSSDVAVAAEIAFARPARTCHLQINGVGRPGAPAHAYCGCCPGECAGCCPYWFRKMARSSAAQLAEYDASFGRSFRRWHVLRDRSI